MAKKTKPAPVYACVMRGLRGCYMPDDSFYMQFDSYAEFTAFVRDEIRSFDMVSSGQIRFAWNHLKKGNDWREVCVAVDPMNSAWGISVSRASVSDYEEQLAESESA